MAPGSHWWIILALFAASPLLPGSSAVCRIPYRHPPWVGFRQHCYLLVKEQLSWADSERHCLMLSGPGKMSHLASILSEEEDDFILDLMQNTRAAPDIIWIGYNDLEKEDDFKWTDGSAIIYENWNGDYEPNNCNNEDCTEKISRLSGTWNDTKCKRKLRFVCKISA